jgi:hypothetical protein
MIGNNLGEKCILERVANNQENTKFEFIRVPIADKGADYEPTWPSKYTREYIKGERSDYEKMGKISIWLRERMCVAVAEENKIFDENDIKSFYPPTDRARPHDRNRFATLDPAYGKNPDSCFRAIVINEIDTDNNWFIQDVRYGRWDAKEMIDQIFDTVVTWGINDFGIERGEYKDIIEPFLDDEKRKRNVWFNVIEMEHARIGSKFERIKMLQPRFKAHSIYFPIGASWIPEMKTELAGVTREGIKSLFIDLVDALAMQTQIAKRPYREMSRTINKRLPRESKIGSPF